MKSLVTFLFLALCPAALIAQQSIIDLISFEYPLTDSCTGGAPLPDGTIVEMMHDLFDDGLDPADTVLRIFVINSESLGYPPGGFAVTAVFTETPVPPLYYVRCCIPGQDWAWVSTIYSITPGYSEAVFTEENWRCVDDAWTGCEFTPVEDILVRLVWFNEQAIDLDLWVTDPLGETCAYWNTPSSSGGQLIRDNLCGNYINGRPETIIWTIAPAGTYTVTVDWFSDCGNSIDSQPFMIEYAVRGEWEIVVDTIDADETLEDISFTFDTTESAQEPLDALTPQTYSLHQNYPNPFNPTTTISFGLPRGDDVTLTIFDVTGRLVSTLKEGHYPAGHHTQTFDGSHLPSGLYFYRVEVGAFTDTRKMILLK